MLPEPVESILEVCRPALAARGIDLRPPLATVAIGGRHRGRKANFAVFAHGDQRPVLFLKTALAAGLDDLRREHQALEELARLDALGASVPRSLGLFQAGDRFAVVESTVPGVPLTTLLRSRRRVRPSRVRRDLSRVQAWLELLHGATVVGETPLGGPELLDAYERELSGDGLLSDERRARLDRLKVAAGHLAGLAVPVTWAHGDLWPGNVLLNRDGLAVVDWGHFTQRGSPLWDLWFLLYTYASAFPWPDRSVVPPEDAFRRAFLSPGWYSDLATELVRRHLRALGLPEESGELLLLVALLARPPRGEGDDEPVGPTGTDWRELALLSAEPAAAPPTR